MEGTSAAVALVLYLVLTAGSEGKALPSTEEGGSPCLCISSHAKFIHPKVIQNVTLSPRGPRCKTVEIIATLKDGREVCLDPAAPWVQLMVKAILASSSGKVICYELTYSDDAK
ncbi:PREDICTED: interleukin-8-like [Buceros rhinoceros silvestris]|uniref:interleukin-8-like n=1 Tax=Buceros rhinoceros silvestris TaxID=175836 RepID=UPI0005292DB1|nr:PREDICTED: interleukin-8-like [Buceros rhinoceros silvestris]